MALNFLSLLRNISEVIARSENSAEVPTQIVKLLATNLNVDVCSVYEYVQESDMLALIATHGLYQEAVGNIQMRPGEGLTGKCFRQRCMINVANPAAEPGFVYFKNTGEEKYKSFLAVPLMTGGKCVGVMTLQRFADKKFPDSVTDAARSLGPQLANLILNADILKNLAMEAPAKTNDRKKTAKSSFLKGIAVNSGIASGKILKLKTRDLINEIEHSSQDDDEKELQLFEKALRLARINTLELEIKALAMISEADASIFNSHLMFLEDKMILDDIRKEIVQEKHSLEFSIVMVYKRFERRFQQLNDPILRERLIDFKDVMLRLLEAADFMRYKKTATQEEVDYSGNWIIVANELLPSDLMRLPINNVVGIACEKGGVTSHVAILAKAFSIPALLGVKGLVSRAKNYDDALLDCHAEKIYLNPDQKLKSSFENLLESEDDEQAVDSGPAMTTDGKLVNLKANISLICETALLRKYGANGIGLYRTEFLFMIRDYIPSEETQYEVFSKIVQDCNDGVTLRLLDAGGDKQISCLNMPKEENPAFGLRGVRMLLAYPDLLRSHLRAVLRAGSHGKLRILLPMVSTVYEVLEIKKTLAAVEAEMSAEKIKFCNDYQLGIMLEVPSTVFGLDKFIEHVDFVSIGTNDLLQFTFALDRGHEANKWEADYFEPVFLKLLATIGETTLKHPGKDISICGEMAGNPPAVPLLIGAGITTFSLSPKIVPNIRRLILALDSTECAQLMKSALECNSAAGVKNILEQFFTAKGLTDYINPEK